MSRYLRHEMIDWFSQEAVSRARVCVVGAGAVGNEVVKNLVLLGAGEIEVIDFDSVEVHNLTRSILFRQEDVGRSKAEVAAERAREIDPSIKVTFKHLDVRQGLTPFRVKSFDALIGCVDNFEARLYLNTIARLAGVNFVNLGIDSRHVVAESFPYGAGHKVACYECGLPPSAYSRMAERYSCGYLKKIAFEERKIPTTIVTSGIAGAFGASMALRLGEPQHEISSSRILLDSIRGLSTVTTELAIAAECPACSTVPLNVTQILSARRQGTIGGLDGVLSERHMRDVTVTLSEPVVASARCVKCEQEPYDGRLRLRAARDLDEAARFCSRCFDTSVDIQYVQEGTLEEIDSIFRESAVPTAYATLSFGDEFVCISFEG